MPRSKMTKHGRYNKAIVGLLLAQKTKTVTLIFLKRVCYPAHCSCLVYWLVTQKEAEQKPMDLQLMQRDLTHTPTVLAHTLKAGEPTHLVLYHTQRDKIVAQWV